MEQSKFISPLELKSKYPLNSTQKIFIENSRKTIETILSAQNGPIVALLGPCSIHNIDEALLFAKELKNLAAEVSESFFVVMRAYTEKPRSAKGWKGHLNDPHLDGSCDIEKGIESTRQFLINLAEMEMPAAVEFLDPFTAKYTSDLISWGCIGARTSNSQIHRQLAASLDLPLGFKNPTDGDIESAVNGILAAREPHVFLDLNEQGFLTKQHAKGNKSSHIVLRGGKSGPNFDPNSIMTAENLLKNKNLNPTIIVDCSHDNSNKCPENQPQVIASITNQIENGNTSIRGIMIESYLESGSQPLLTPSSLLKFGVSVTDPCLSFEETKKALLLAHSKLKRIKNKELSIK